MLRIGLVPALGSVVLGIALLLALPGISHNIGIFSSSPVASASTSCAEPDVTPISTPTSPPAGSPAPNYLHTEGRKLVDAHGNEVTITGVNWFGLETGTFAPHGLWSRSMDDMLDQVVVMGFNTLRVPFSNELFDPSAIPNGIDFAANPDLEGLSGLEILDRLVVKAGQRGLKVILDRHRPSASGQSQLWYTDHYDEERWIADWVMLAERYKGNDTIIGMDLHNEPHGPATWGSGNPSTDWRMAAERAGNAILAVNPDLLIVVEGVESYDGKGYWWGGNLEGAGDYPIRLDVPNRLVYSAHDYGPGVWGQPWFGDPTFPDNLVPMWERHWAYLAQQDIAPVLLGEFGGRSVGEDTEGVWQRTLVAFLKEHGIHYTYWSLNPNSGDTGGVLQDDWASPHAEKLALLQTYQAPLIGNTNPTLINGAPAPWAGDTGSTPVGGGPTPSPTPTVTLAPTPTPTPTPTPEPTPLPVVEVQYRTARTEWVTNNPAPELRLRNPGPEPVDLSRVEVRYWTSPRDADLPQALDVDWAGMGRDHLVHEFVREDGRAYLRLAFGPNSGRLWPGNETEVKVRLHKEDWAPYLQTLHYSFAPVSSYTPWPRVTVYVDSQLVWGVEPDPVAAP